MGLERLDECVGDDRRLEAFRLESMVSLQLLEPGLDWPQVVSRVQVEAAAEERRSSRPGCVVDSRVADIVVPLEVFRSPDDGACCHVVHRDEECCHEGPDCCRDEEQDSAS